jgi:hypothetical protein
LIGASFLPEMTWHMRNADRSMRRTPRMASMPSTKGAYRLAEGGEIFEMISQCSEGGYENTPINRFRQFIERPAGW